MWHSKTVHKTSVALTESHIPQVSEPLAGHKDNVVSMIANKRMNNQVATGGLHTNISRKTIVTTRASADYTRHSS